MAKKKQQQKSSRRRDGIRIREVARRQFQADFTVSLGSGQRLRFRRRSPSPTIEGTRAWAERERAAIIKRGGIAPAEAPAADPTSPRSFGYWARRYYDECEREGVNRPGTLKSKKSSLILHLIPAFEERSVGSFLPEDIRQYALERRPKIVHGTLQREVILLRAVLRHAKRYGNSAERSLDLPEYRLRKPTEAREKIPVALSEHQTKELLEAAKDAQTRAAFTCLFRQGLRIGEVQGLRWGVDVDLGARRMHIQQTWLEFIHDWGEPKSGKPRTIAIDPETLQVLKDLGEGESGALIFPSLLPSLAKLGQPISRGTVTERLRVAAKAAGITVRMVTKIGRHSIGRHWAERGWPMRGLQEFLGHHDVTVTQIYAHWSVGATATLLDSRTAEPAEDARAERAKVRALLEEHGVDTSAGLVPAISSVLALTNLRPKLDA